LRVEAQLERTVRAADVLIAPPWPASRWYAANAEGDSTSRRWERMIRQNASDRRFAKGGACSLILWMRRPPTAMFTTHRANIYARRIDGEIGEVLAGTKSGVRPHRIITVAKFVGIGAQTWRRPRLVSRSWNIEVVDSDCGPDSRSLVYCPSA